MDIILTLLSSQPMLSLFITISIGYFVGKFRIKQFKLGGIAGSLLVGVLIGQLGIKIPEIIGTFFFALFIYAVGYQGGPQFFSSLNKQTLVELISATITCILGLICVLIAAQLFHLDRGTAAGLAAGGLTQSAMIGSAGGALAKLNVSPEMHHLMQSNVAVGYAVCYIFGSFGPILLLATIFPAMMGWDLRKEGQFLAQSSSNEGELLEPGQFHALSPFSARTYEITHTSKLIDQAADPLFKNEPSIMVNALQRQGQVIPVTPDTTLKIGDRLVITAPTNKLIQYHSDIGNEISSSDKLDVIEEQAKVVLTHHKLEKQTINQLSNMQKGVFITAVTRLGEKLGPTPELSVRKGDEIVIVGTSQHVNKAAAQWGYKLPQQTITDFIFFGLGMTLGFLLGMIQFTLFGINITLGAGVGCLFSGLLFGWLKSTHPRFATLPSGASNFLRDFGLAVFVSVIGITAGPQAITTMQKYGLELFFLGIGVTLIPQILTFYISYYILKIKNPITLLSTIAGGRSANPGFAALLEKVGNSTPVVPFTATYALANILLTLWGPLIIGMVTTNPPA